MPKVFITSRIPGDAQAILTKHNFKVDINNEDRNLTKDELKSIVKGYDAILTLVNDKIDEDIINIASNNLKIISNYAVGFDNIDVLAANKKNIVVTNTPGVANESVAEHVFAMMMALSKMLVPADRFVRQGKFKRWDPNIFLSGGIWGKTLGILGLGKIGSFVGYIAHNGFNMKILYHDLTRSEDFELLDDAEFASHDKLLKNSDFVTLHVPLTVHTKHLISKAQFKLMKETAILINTSRGPVVDEEALIWALREGKIAGAGLDVFEHEPHIEEALKTLSNVVMTPHTASATVETRDKMSKIAAENIIDVFGGKTPFGLVKVS